MIQFKDNFLILLKYMQNSLDENYPLEKNLLNNSYINETYLEQIDVSFKEEKEMILNLINQDKKEYSESINNILNDFINDNGTSFQKIVVELLNNLDEYFLSKLIDTFNNEVFLILKNIKKLIDDNIQLGNEYMNNVNKVNSYHITEGFINKYNIFINNYQNIINFVYNELNDYIREKYFFTFNKIKEIIQDISYKNDLIYQKYIVLLARNKTNENNSFQIILEKIEKCMDKHFYNQKFLHLINGFISYAYNSLINGKTQFDNIYNNMVKKSYSKINEDYDIENVSGGDRYCCRYVKIFGKKICYDHCRHPYVYTYEGKNVDGTNNYLLIKNIQLSDIFSNMNGKINKIYLNITSNLSSYYSYLSSLISNIENTKNEISKKRNLIIKINLQNKINNIIREKLGDKLLKITYVKFNNKIENILPKSLNSISEQWKMLYDDIYKNISLNKDNFKSTINELYFTSLNYFELYKQNISYDYINSVIEKLKNDFNYSIKYYYEFVYLKLHNFCYEILYDLSKNEKPFNEIINIKSNVINNLCIDLLNEIKNSKNKFLSITNQEIIINITSNNFFNIDDILNEHLNSFNIQFNESLNNLSFVIEEINYQYIFSNNYLIPKYFLENNINKNQIKNIYDAIYKEIFIDLYYDNYLNMINNTNWKNDKIELIKSLDYSIKELDMNTINDFNEELKQYQIILREKLNTDFYTKQNLKQKIDSLFLNGTNTLNDNSIKEIIEILDSILIKIKNHFTNEEVRLLNENISYSNNFILIQNRLNNYKNQIYEKFNSAITSVVDDLYSKMIEIFYKNHIEKNLVKFRSYFNNSNFGSYQFVNASINLDEIMSKEIDLLINEYQNEALEYIENAYQQKIYYLAETFGCMDIKQKINDEIDTFYNSSLYLILSNLKLNNSNENVSDYDFSPLIINDIDESIGGGMNEIKIIIKNQMEGNTAEIYNIFQVYFRNIKEDAIDVIKEQFLNFTLTQNEKEKIELNTILKDKISNNFQLLLSYIIQSFTHDYFDRILKLNDIQKINILYKQLKYSLNQTKSYYLSLSEKNRKLNLPDNIKNDILSLNKVESLIEIKTNEIIYLLKQTITKNIERAKKPSIIQTYV